MADGKVIFEIHASAKGVKVVQKQTDALAKSSEKADKSTKKLTKSRDAYNRREKGAAQISSVVLCKYQLWCCVYISCGAM